MNDKITKSSIYIIFTLILFYQACSSRGENNELSNKPIYQEELRPQFHFSPKTNWTNDPNGMVYYGGTYHLFFQHNPVGIDWGNMTWGHAVSEDMVHWEELDDEIYPDKLGTIFSGTATIDWDNSAGLQEGDEKTIVAFYTYCGPCEQFGKPGGDEPFTQAMAYSTDGGKTFTKYSGNPILGNQTGGSDRDPKVFWHEPSGKWVMTLFLDYNSIKESNRVPKGSSYNWKFGIFNSDDMITWEQTSELDDLELYECPELFELPVDGNPNNTKWVMWDAPGDYFIGDFDGKTFTRESGKHIGDYGSNFYASQTYNDIPDSDGRRIQIAWMAGGEYPGMPFNQQMSFPTENTLRTTEDGIRMFREPIEEIENIYVNEFSLSNKLVSPNENPIEGFEAALLDVQLEVEPRGASDFGVMTNELKVRYYVDEEILAAGRHNRQTNHAPLKMKNGRIKLRILIDRSSIEVFGNDGRVSISSNYDGSRTAESGDANIRFFTNGGQLLITSLKIYELSSIWPQS